MQQPLPVAGTISNFYFHTQGASATTAITPITLFVNGVATNITCNVPSGGSSCSDTTHTATITAGQAVTVENAGTAGANDIMNGVSWSAQIG